MDDAALRGGTWRRRRGLLAIAFVLAAGVSLVPSDTLARCGDRRPGSRIERTDAPSGGAGVACGQLASPPAEAAAPRGEPGFYSVDSRPYATIFIDGASLGDTPLYRARVTPGTHDICARRSDGKVQKFKVTIVSRQLTSSGRLRW